MGKYKGKRITITISHELAAAAERLRLAAGFAHAVDVYTAAIKAMVLMSEQAQLPPPPIDAYADIDEMFSQYADFERADTNVFYKRKHNRKLTS